MDRSPRVDVLLARAVDQQLNEQRSWRGALESMEERLEALEETIAGLESRLKRWSDPSEIAEEVSGLEEEISLALGRFYKRLDAAINAIQPTVRKAVGAEVDAVAGEVETLAAALRSMTTELQVLVEGVERMPRMLEEHRATLARELKSPMKRVRRRDRRVTPGVAELAGESAPDEVDEED